MIIPVCEETKRRRIIKEEEAKTRREENIKYI
jgi:hypothetical protein